MAGSAFVVFGVVAERMAGPPDACSERRVTNGSGAALGSLLGSLAVLGLKVAQAVVGFLAVALDAVERGIGPGDEAGVHLRVNRRHGQPPRR